MKVDLILDTFNQAYRERKPESGLIVHSDGGGQYASKQFRNRLAKLGIQQSMTRRDNYYDNTFAESLFSRIKAELIEDGVFQSIEEAKIECFEYIETYYNTKRRHSSLDYLSPKDFELQLQTSTEQLA